DEGWHAGVIGIVASRLVKKYYRPVIVLAIERESMTATGSARSIEGFDMFANLASLQDWLSHFGGHPMAAGMTLPASNIDLLRERLNEQAADILQAEDLIPIQRVDAILRPGELTLETIDEIARLGPFGVGNPVPKVMIRETALEQIR